MHTRIHAKRIFALAALAAWALLPAKVQAQDMSIRTNLLWDAVAEPNIGLEFAVGDHVTVGANGALKAWPRWLAWDWDRENPVHWRNFAVVPEVRYYINEVYQGFFAGADAVYTHFNVGQIKFPFGLYPDAYQYREQGSFWGGGLFVGYAWWPFQHWRFELEAGAAMGLAAYDRFDCANCGTKLSEERHAAVVPKLAVNVAYNPVSKDKRKARKAALTLTGRDTITVLTPPVTFVVQLQEVKTPETVADTLSRENNWVIPIQKYRPLDYLTRPGRDSITYIRFEKESDVLRRDYPQKPVKDLHRNARTLDQLQKAIETIRDAESTSEILISVVGLASIDGPRVKNDTLALHRARAVADYLQEKTFIGRRHFEIIGKGEAWDWFKDQLEAIPDGGEGFTAQEVKSLLDIVYFEPDPDVREKTIKSNPALYKKIVENLLEEQRNSGYIRIYYNNRPSPAVEKMNGPVAKALQAKDYKQAVQTIQADKDLMALVQQDPEAANAYGIALYFTALDKKDQALEKEALGLLQEAARKGSQAAAENLEGIKTYGPARKEYEAWLQIMNENKKQ